MRDLLPKKFQPIVFFRSRFRIQAPSLWRVMRLLRPYRKRIILANVMAGLATTAAGFCLLSLHPLFQMAMERVPGASEGIFVEVESADTPQPVEGSHRTESGEALEAQPELTAGSDEPDGIGGLQDEQEPSISPPAGVGEGDADSEGSDAEEEPGNPIVAKLAAVREYVKRFAGESPALQNAIQSIESGIETFMAWAQESTTRIIALYMAFIVCIYLVSQFFSFLGSYLLGQVAIRVTMKLMRDVYGNLLRQEYNYFNTQSSGALLNLCHRQVLQLRNIIKFLVSTRIMIPINMLIMFFVLLGISTKLSILLLCLLPLVFLPVMYLIRRMRQGIRDELDDEAGTIDVMSEGIQGILAIKAFGAEKLEEENLEPSIQKYLRTVNQRLVAQSLMGPLVDFTNMMVLLFVFFLTMFVLRQSMTLEPSRIILFLFAVTRFNKPLRSLLTMNIQMQRSAQMANRIFQILDRTPEIRENRKGRDFPPHWRTITLDNVSLTYFPHSKNKPKTKAEERARREALQLRRAEEDLKHMRSAKEEERRVQKLEAKKEMRKQQVDRPALIEVDLQIHRGEKIALIGPNGAGKSSLVNLLCRLYDPTEGQILIDDLDFKRIRLSSLHEHVCLVTQQTVLFNRTVRDNIAFGLEGLADDQIRAAARLTGAHGFIMNLPEQYDTKIGEGGRHLSGGERQKIALARAFVRNPDLLILDEPTTGLDHKTTTEFMDVVFDPRNQHLTLIFITHEPSQLSRFERILSLTPDKKIVDIPPVEARTAPPTHETLAGQQHTA